LEEFHEVVELAVYVSTNLNINDFEFDNYSNWGIYALHVRFFYKDFLSPSAKSFDFGFLDVLTLFKLYYPLVNVKIR